MPFITQDRRDIIDVHGLNEKLLHDGIQPGDICYYYYKPMVDRWEKEPRWTTAHVIYLQMITDRHIKDMLMNAEHRTARELAWQVFFNMYVMPYELQKMKENGSIGE